MYNIKNQNNKTRNNKTRNNKTRNNKNKKKSLLYNRAIGGYVKINTKKNSSIMNKNHITNTNTNTNTNSKSSNGKSTIGNSSNITNPDSKLFKKLKENEWVYNYYNSSDDDTIKKPSKTKRCMCINYKSINDFKTYDRCSRIAIKNTDFCELHQDCKSYLRNFLSGDEPEYKPELWSDPYVEGSHNCYSYFLNRQIKAVKEKCNEICEKKHKSTCPIKDSECTDLKPQPGDFDLIKKTGSDKEKERIYKCPNMHRKIIKDNPSLIPVPFNVKCPKNYYKGAYVVDPDNTYHFYRANTDATWSHKPGISPISNVDSSKQPIYVPHFANRNYEEDENNDEAINYTNFCGYYCIPTNNTVHKNLA
jgi:hypothetical protein